MIELLSFRLRGPLSGGTFYRKAGLAWILKESGGTNQSAEVMQSLRQE
jgi:hypothetical protein